ncbi:hypothetical protein FJTKL_06546 [Diaporthe vaccinii]|uniref:Uncharacterized protein n=1 Tax=Diaporthe vaccinii TaxID=105482 RepID=A0ABR4DPZ0_9PEZI
MRSVAKAPGLISGTSSTAVTNAETIGRSKYHQELMEVDHDQLIEDLAKYKQLNTHFKLRLQKLEGELNERDWPLLVKHGETALHVAILKVEVLCMLADDGTDVQHIFSCISDFSST